MRAASLAKGQAGPLQLDAAVTGSLKHMAGEWKMGHQTLLVVCLGPSHLPVSPWEATQPRLHVSGCRAVSEGGSAVNASAADQRHGFDPCPGSCRGIASTCMWHQEYQDIFPGTANAADNSTSGVRCLACVQGGLPGTKLYRHFQDDKRIREPL